ncbi:hypothetical protein ASPZODRAFT_149654 [Penicilliopsis zonata CBS 506.65]|uniref:Major facilitator superfamily (MFS) profile domain-containing protein n=1 Tax=Penicilliopsis zonata CBS 506.65 TaxID=1073090 RepID=A0A1L9ST42_9EURO|nr:hypothetical protein ASPZODRAFT_149654 [Penicilliopsis zonata CBS 506.65]OJJ50271.1 hypothetical protein ASPZODRAFT_149654 [Penicilliopsis zonata CBS 506.65]
MTESKSQEPAPREFTTPAILAALGGFCGLFCGVGFINAFGIFEEYYKANQLAAESDSAIGWIGSVAILFIFGASVVSGYVLDRFGPGPMLCFGSVGLVIALMMTSLCHQLYQFILAQGLLLGLSIAFLTCPSLAIQAQYFRRRISLAMGIVISGSSTGGVIWPIAIRRMIENPSLGFAWTMRIVGFIMIPLLAIACLFTRTNPKKAATVAVSNTETQIQTQKKDSALFSLPIILSCLSFFTIYFGMFAPFFYTTDYAISHGFSSSLAFYTVSIINGASFFGRILPGLLADHVGKFNCCIVAAFLSGIIACCWTTVSSVAGLVIFSAAYGFTSGAILSLQPACAAQISTPSTRGFTIGLIMASTSLSAMAGTPISGQLIESYGYLSLALYSGISLLIGSVFLAAARLSQNRNVWAVV